MPETDIPILLALGAALVSALGSVIRQRSAHEIVDRPVGAWELFLLSLRDSRWWLGGGAAVDRHLRPRRSTRARTTLGHASGARFGDNIFKPFQ